MPLGKRSRSVTKRSRVPYARRAKRARYLGRTGLAGMMRASVRPSVAQRVNNLYRMIETKESDRVGTPNLALAHNNITVYGSYNQANLPNILVSVANPFSVAQGTGDPMTGVGNRVGDKITVKGLLIKGFMENALSRSKVFYRVMLLRGAKGEPFDRASVFKNVTTNKMIDQVNNERYTVVAQKIFNINTSNDAPTSVDAAGQTDSGTGINRRPGIGTRTFKMWIPGVKFGYGGNITYENGSPTQVKFYDYRLCILAYDWFGTPQDLNAVGRVNELFMKLYYKDA